MELNNYNLNGKSNFMDTHLYQACKNGNIAKVKLLVGFGISPNCSYLDNEFNLSTLAAACLTCSRHGNQRQRDIVKLLLTAGGDPALRNKRGLTILHYLVRYSQDYKMLEVLLNSKKVRSDVRDDQGDTPLHVLCKHEEENPVNLNKVKILLKYGANPLAVNASGQTPLCHVLLKAKLQFLKAFLSTGINANGNPSADCTPIDNAVKGYVHHADKDTTFSAYFSCIQQLQAHGADINCLSTCCFCPLHYTLKHQAYSMTKFLLARGANPNMTDLAGSTPLHTAYIFSTYFENDFCDIDKVLLECGADPNMVTYQTGLVPACSIASASTLGLGMHPSLWIQKIMDNFRAGLLMQNLPSIVQDQIQDFMVKQADYSVIDFLHACKYRFRLDNISESGGDGKVKKYMMNLNREAFSLAIAAAHVVRLNLRPNVIRGVQLLDCPPLMDTLITLGYAQSNKSPTSFSST